MKKIKKYIYVLFRAGYNTVDHDGIEHAGYMSFMNILSLFPFVVFIVALAGFIGGTQFGTDFINILVQSLPEESVDVFKTRMQEIILGPPHGLMTLSIVGAIWTASSSVEGIRTILNRVYKVKTPPTYIFRRLTSIVQFLGLTAIIIFSMFLFVLIPIIYNKLDLLLQIKSVINIDKLIPTEFFDPVSAYVRRSALVVTLFFVVSMLYYVVPNIKIKFKSVIPGAIIVVISWVVVGTTLASLIADYKQMSIIYGGLAGTIISMLFFFVTNVIFIYGSEVNFLLEEKE